MEYYLGIDIGTSSAKAVAFSGSGAVLGSHSVQYPMLHPEAGYSEQEPELIFEAVMENLQRIQSAQGGPPVLVSFSAAMHSLILMDKEGRPLTRCIIWADNRAGAIAKSLRFSEQGARYYELSGVPLHAMSPFCKLQWFAREDPELLGRAHKIIGIREYILYRLFAVYLTDTSMASATGLFDIRSLKWAEELLAVAGIQADQLPRIVAPSHIIEEPFCESAARQLPGYGETRFIVGASDGVLANLGTGVVDAGLMAVTIGTSSAARITLSKPYTDPRQRTFCYHLEGEKYVLGGAGNNGAVILEWMKEQFIHYEGSYDQLMEEAAAAPAGSEGLIFHPYLLGERAPLWDSDLSGMFSGLRMQHGRSHLLRSTLEGILLAVYSFGQVLLERESIREIRASGGFTKSPFWVQMLADIFGLPVVLVEREDSSAWGAVMMGLKALGKKVPETVLSAKPYQPDAQQHQLYKQVFQQYRFLYEQHREAFTGHPGL